MTSLQVNRSSLWGNLWVQLGSSIVITSFIPYLFRLWQGLDGRGLDQINFTITIACIATVVSIWLTRHISTYPGQEFSTVVLPAFGLSYGVLFFFLILFRFSYSNAHILFSLGTGVGWMLLVRLLSQRRRLHIGVLPFDTMSEMLAIERVYWKVLQSPEDPVDGFDAVVADLRSDIPDDWDARLADYALAGLPVFHSKHLLESLTGQVQLEHLSENSFGSLTPLQAWMTVKHIVDWIMAALLLLMLLPIMILLGIVIRISSPGPALFIQERIGYRGRPFHIYKFRTMTANTNTGGGTLDAAITREGDSRITRLGKILRKTRLDELPQLINVLKGEMSFIGPRPEATILSLWYEKEIPFYRYRHIVRPGIAGWAQICQGHVTDIDAVRGKLHYDFYYIKYYSLWIDMLIVVRTIKTMITGYGAK